MGELVIKKVFIRSIPRLLKSLAFGFVLIGFLFCLFCVSEAIEEQIPFQTKRQLAHAWSDVWNVCGVCGWRTNPMVAIDVNRFAVICLFWSCLIKSRISIASSFDPTSLSLTHVCLCV